MTDMRSAGPITAQDFELFLPDSADAAASQDEEWCEISLDGSDDRERIRFHDYDRIYSIPGLYERLIYEELECESPPVVAGLLTSALAERSVETSELRVLDLGAGNGIVAEELAEEGAGHLVGVDIIPEAAMAAERDRPGLYDDYVVADLLDRSSGAHEQLKDKRLNALACVAALGFGDIPPQVFLEGLECITTPGWVAFTIKADFLGTEDGSGFADVIDSLVKEEKLDVVASQRYRHRFSWAGEPLEYVAMVAEKRADV